MTKLEKRLQKVPRRIASAIRFYERKLSPEVLEECEHAKGTEYYVDLLLEKYKEMFRR